MKKILKFKPWEKEDEYYYAKLSKSASTDKERTWARDKLISPIYVNVAAKSYRFHSLYYIYNNVDLNIFDLINEGNIGLMKAAEKFDPNMEARFITYADKWIDGSISRYLKVDLIKVLLNKKETQETQEKSKKGFDHGNSLADLEDELATKYFLKSNFQDIDSLDALCEDPDGYFKDALIDHRGIDSAYKMLEDEERKYIINAALDTLPEQSKNVLKMRFGLIDGRGATLKQTANKTDLTIDQVRHLEKKAQLTLRDSLMGRELKEHF